SVPGDAPPRAGGCALRVRGSQRPPVRRAPPPGGCPAGGRRHAAKDPDRVGSTCAPASPECTGGLDLHAHPSPDFSATGVRRRSPAVENPLPSSHEPGPPPPVAAPTGRTPEDGARG